jgi:hypothetical protein
MTLAQSGESRSGGWMTKIRCDDSIGIDLDQVIAWSKGKIRLALENNEVLFLYLAGIDKPISVNQGDIGCQAFARLHKLLLDQFMIDLDS